MRKIETTPAFDKAMKKVKKYDNFKQKKFDKALEQLVNNQPLDPTFRDHKTVKHSDKEHQGSRIFHAAPDIVVIYKILPDTILLQYIGKHNNLFENLN